MEYRDVCIFPFGTCFPLVMDEILIRHFKINSHQFSIVWYKCPQSSKTISGNQAWHSNSPTDLHPIRQQIPKTPLGMKELLASWMCQVPPPQIHFCKRASECELYGKHELCVLFIAASISDSAWALMCALKLVWTLSPPFIRCDFQ